MKIIDIHQVNVIGLGAKIFSAGVVEQIENNDNLTIANKYVNKAILVDYSSETSNIISVDYWLGFWSRLCEIFFWRFYREQHNELIVLGDLPLNTSVKQYVLCHQSLIFKSFTIGASSFYKFLLFRICYKLFVKKDDVVLVQSEEMKKNIHDKISQKINVKVITLQSMFANIAATVRDKRIFASSDFSGLSLFYPAAFYPHKNHYLLNSIDLDSSTQVTVTISNSEFPSESRSINHIGRISRDEVFELYKEVDALLFLSSNESLGMPILEAIKCNIPIICPRVEYSRKLSSDNCFFFEINDPKSLEDAISLLREKLNSGWWPKWSVDNVIADDVRVEIDHLILGL
jgi:hypothetical protein